MYTCHVACFPVGKSESPLHDFSFVSQRKSIMDGGVVVVVVNSHSSSLSSSSCHGCDCCVGVCSLSVRSYTDDWIREKDRCFIYNCQLFDMATKKKLKTMEERRAVRLNHCPLDSTVLDG